MKIIVLLSVLLVSSFAFALGKAGDKASYNTKMVAAGQSYQGTITVELAKSASNQLVLRTSSTLNGVLRQEEKLADENSIVTDLKIVQIMGNCKQMNGVEETVVVPAGTFNSCKVALPQNAGSVNFAAVPFGIAKLSDGELLSMELLSFVEGK